MIRPRITFLAFAASVVLSLPAAGQGLGTYKEAVKKAEGAANATNQNIAAQTGQDVRVAGKQNTGKSSGPAAEGTAGSEKPAAAPASLAPANSNAVPQVTREIFTYGGTGRRDPFYSLILTEELRPLLTDLRLVGILYAASGGKSVAIMRDLQTNAQYRVSMGMTLGRMRVVQIKPRSVIFNVDEFGLQRQDSLFMADTSKTRIR